MICSDSQPCHIIQSPNSGFDGDKISVQTTPEEPILMSPNPYVGQPSIDWAAGKGLLELNGLMTRTIRSYLIIDIHILLHSNEPKFRSIAAS